MHSLDLQFLLLLIQSNRTSRHIEFFFFFFPSRKGLTNLANLKLAIQTRLAWNSEFISALIVVGLKAKATPSYFPIMNYIMYM